MSQVEMNFFSDQALDRNICHREVLDSRAGAVLVFEGTVRNHSDGLKDIIALEYEAKLPMANKVIDRILREVSGEIPIHRAWVMHRVGRVLLLEPAVLIAVSSSHRDEAYRASRRIIDRIKHEAPIWKREILSSGESQWSLGCTACSAPKADLRKKVDKADEKKAIFGPGHSPVRQG